MIDYDKGGHLPPPRSVEWNVLFYIVLGADDDAYPDAHFEKFATTEEANAFAAVYGGDVYPVVDVKVPE